MFYKTGLLHTHPPLFYQILVNLKNIQKRGGVGIRHKSIQNQIEAVILSGVKG